MFLVILVFLIFSNLKYIYTANCKFFEQRINAASYSKENEFYALYICAMFGQAGRFCCKTCLRVQNLFSAFWKHIEHVFPTSDIIQLNLCTDLAGRFLKESFKGDN